MKYAYIEKAFKAMTLARIEQANKIIVEYQAQGLLLTLRQLYYQFVARALIPNTERSYKTLGKTINDGRMAGLIDWDAIEDRTRNLVRQSSWQDPAHAIRSIAHYYREDLWSTQPYRVEVWIEKEALTGVIEGVCERLRVPYFACRGYVSQSEQWRAGERFSEYGRKGQEVIMLHLGDHDPSGMDMTRDNDSRLQVFSTSRLDVRRIALNMDQIELYSPPPNPAKVTDSRFDAYLLQYGDESWELDALDPTVFEELIEDQVNDIRDDDLWAEALAAEDINKDRLEEIAMEEQS